MHAHSTTEPQAHQFQEVPPAETPQVNLGIDDLKAVKLTITADLGRSVMRVRDVLELQQGSLIQLDKLAGEMTDIYVNGLPLAKGEIVVIGDALHVRVGEIAGQAQKSDESAGDEYDGGVDDDDEI